jgi:2-methylisocitrate lyase-like PEP mutase family enzyme
LEVLIKNLTASLKRQHLRTLLQQDKAVIAPGIYDGYGARLVQNSGFQAAYMTGNGVSASLLGTPDIGQVDLTLMSDHARRVAACINIPLICDADTGYGGVLNIKRTIAEFEAAGVAAIHMEDQTFPKQCAQFAGARSVLSFTEALNHIKAAVSARTDPQMMLIARTDSAGSLGIDEAIKRAKSFIAAGADAVFVELKANPDALAMIQLIKQEVKAPCLFNVDVGGPISQLKASEFKSHGIDIAIHPSLARGIFGHAMNMGLKHLQTEGKLGDYSEHMFNPKQYSEALGLPEIQAWEAEFTSDKP